MSTHLRIIGGLRSNPRSAEDLLLVSLIGGASVDLSAAELAPITRITKVSLIGGVDLTVPAGTKVVVQGFSLLGGGAVPPADPDAKNTVVVRNWGVIGGVRVRQR